MKQVNEIVFSYLLNFGSIHLLNHQRKCWYQLQWDLSWFSDLSMTLLSYPMGVLRYNSDRDVWMKTNCYTQKISISQNQTQKNPLA